MEQVEQARQLFETQHEVRNLEFDFRTKSSEIRTALLSFELTELDGKPHVLAVFRDWMLSLLRQPRNCGNYLAAIG